MKTPQERTQQAVDTVKKKPSGKVGRKRIYFTNREVQDAKNRYACKRRGSMNQVRLEYKKIEDYQENEKFKKAVSGYIRPLFNKFVRKYKKSLA